MLSFETALYMAEEIAKAKQTEITGLTWYPGSQYWLACFGATGVGCSHVTMNRVAVPEYLKEYDAHWHSYEAGDDEDDV